MKKHHPTPQLFLAILFLGALLPAMTPPAATAQETVPVVSAVATVDAVIVEELNKLIGGWVSVTLNSGTVFSGKVMKVRDGMVHLGQVQNKEYYEALLRISDISALGARFRAKNKQ
jgi:hypothetical protein